MSLNLSKCENESNDQKQIHKIIPPLNCFLLFFIVFVYVVLQVFVVLFVVVVFFIVIVVFIISDIISIINIIIRQNISIPHLSESRGWHPQPPPKQYISLKNPKTKNGPCSLNVRNAVFDQESPYYNLKKLFGGLDRQTHK